MSTDDNDLARPEADASADGVSDQPTAALPEAGSQQPTEVLADDASDRSSALLPGTPAERSTEVLADTTVVQPAAALLETPRPDAMAASSAPLTAAGPRIRWGAVIWGVVFAAIAATVLVVVTDAERRDDLATWLRGLTPGGIALALAVVLGGILLVAGLAGVARRASRRSA